MDFESIANSAVPDGPTGKDEPVLEGCSDGMPLSEYDSAISYITALIDQLNGGQLKAENDPWGRFSEPQNAAKSDTKRLSEIVGRASRVKDHPDVISDLREAAFLATSMALQLSECSRYARRSYSTVCLATAAGLFSVAFLAMSPRRGSIGFMAAVAAFLLAIVMGFIYLLSLKVLRRKMALLRKTGLTR
jgi:hypothetical protein